MKIEENLYVVTALIGMNSELMKKYIRFVAIINGAVRFTKIYNDNIDFMDNTLLDGKTNFFEKRVSEYVHSSTATAKDDKDFEFDDDFNF